MKPSVFALAAAAALLTTPMRPAQAAPRTKPIVILVHGAFAESASWNAVIARSTRQATKRSRLPIHYAA